MSEELITVIALLALTLPFIIMMIVYIVKDRKIEKEYEAELERITKPKHSIGAMKLEKEFDIQVADDVWVLYRYELKKIISDYPIYDWCEEGRGDENWAKKIASHYKLTFTP